jgi:hypothetical protein
MMQTLTTRPRSTPKNTALILELALGAWVVLLVGGYLFGVGFLTLLEIIGGAL